MDTLLIWGTGKNSLEFLEKCDLEKLRVTAFVDNDESRRGQEFQGLKVLSPAQALEMEFDALVICSVYHREIRNQAEEMGFPQDKLFSFSQHSITLMKKYGKSDPYPQITMEQVEVLESVSWYHSFELFPGVVTPGRQAWHKRKLEYFEASEGQAAGKTVLDIGAWDGPYTFEMERRGARVTSYDIQDPETSGYNIAKKFLGSQAEYIRGSVYDLDPAVHGAFDIVLFLGVFYHLQNPVLALEKIYNVLNPCGLLVFEGAILDGAHKVDEYWSTKKDVIEQCIDLPVCFYSKGKFQRDHSNWHVPTARCLNDWMESVGFEVLALDKMEQDARAYGAARKVDDHCCVEHDIY